MKSCLIATVGISLFNWLKRHDNTVLEEGHEKIANYLHARNLGNQASAEISSIQSILNEQVLDKNKELWLLVSDTAEGSFTGEVVAKYFEPIFEKVYTLAIPGLNASNSEMFRDEGLRQLVKATSQIIYSAKNKNEECVINATGGYKAQISFVGLIGQVLKIPVYYQFEDFSSTIHMPQMPITLDDRIWIKNFNIFDKLYRYGTLPHHEIDESFFHDKEITNLVEVHHEQYRLSSVGLLMHEVLLHRFSKDGNVYLPKPLVGSEISLESKQILYFPETIPLSLKTLLETIRNLEYVCKISFLRVKEYFVGRTSFKCNKNTIGSVEGCFSDGLHSWYFTIHTISNEFTEDLGICVDLNLRFSNPFENPKPGNVQILLIRHGQHTGEKEKRIEGWADFELTETGKQQALLVAERLNKDFYIDALYSSSVMRARQTAEIISNKLSLSIKKLDDLRAMNYGAREGLKKYEASVLFPKTRDSRFITNNSWGRETEMEFSRRVLESFYEIYYAHPGETVAIVTHGRAISTIIREVLRLPISHDFRVSADDTSIHYVEMGPDKIELHYVNNTEHLQTSSYVGGK